MQGGRPGEAWNLARPPPSRHRVASAVGMWCRLRYLEGGLGACAGGSKRYVGRPQVAEVGFVGGAVHRAVASGGGVRVCGRIMTSRFLPSYLASGICSYLSCKPRV